MDLFDMTQQTLDSLHLKSSTSAAPDSLTNPPQNHLRMAPPPSYLESLAEGLSPLRNTPTLVLGVQSDYLFPVDQQREVADALRMAGNTNVVYYELGGVWGHDTFL